MNLLIECGAHKISEAAAIMRNIFTFMHDLFSTIVPNSGHDKPLFYKYIFINCSIRRTNTVHFLDRLQRYDAAFMLDRGRLYLICLHHVTPDFF